jgi:hypothetical protein
MKVQQLQAAAGYLTSNTNAAFNMVLTAWGMLSTLYNSRGPKTAYTGTPVRSQPNSAYNHHMWLKQF